MCVCGGGCVGVGVEAMCLLGTADPDVSWLYSRLSGILLSSQLRELSGLACSTWCRFLGMQVAGTLGDSAGDMGCVKISVVGALPGACDPASREKKVGNVGCSLSDYF